MTCSGTFGTAAGSTPMFALYSALSGLALSGGGTRMIGFEGFEGALAEREAILRG